MKTQNWVHICYLCTRFTYHGLFKVQFIFFKGIILEEKNKSSILLRPVLTDFSHVVHNFFWFKWRRNQNCCNFFEVTPKINLDWLYSFTNILNCTTNFLPYATISDFTNCFPKIILSIFYIVKFWISQLSIHLFLEKFSLIFILRSTIIRTSREVVSLRKFQASINPRHY